MSYVSHLQCSSCGTNYPSTELINLCPKDNRPLEMILDLEQLQSEQASMSWYHPEIKSIWRFGALMALDITLAEDKKHIISLGEGHTPLIPLTDFSLAKQHNFSLFIKDEGQPHKGYGANPTASFKDRGMSMAASMAKRFGLKKLVVPTQGNAGDSLAEYALSAGFEVAVIMPDDTPMPILGKVAAMAKIHPQVSLDLVKGTIREAGELMKQKYLPQGYFNCATFQEPGWRIEGKKSLGLELAEPREGSKSEWKLPDVVLYPTGGGTGILGMWKAFGELETLGVIGSERPRIISVQSEQTAPVVEAFHRGDTDTQVVTSGTTLATGLNVPGGVGHAKVLDIIKQSKGVAIAVTEEQIAESFKTIYQDYNIWICPEGAATIAALPEAIEKGLIKTGDEVVTFNTGSFEKYLPDLKHLIF